MDELMIQIPVEEYKRLMLKAVRVDILHDRFIKHKYVMKDDIAEIMGWEEEVKEDEQHTV